MPRPSATNELYLIIDDDPLSIFLTRTILQNALVKATVIDFTAALRALAFIKEVAPSDEIGRIVIFLDLNMPETDGKEFVRLYAGFPREIRAKAEIHILTSSIDANDVRFASENVHVKSLFTKPLTVEALQRLE